MVISTDTNLKIDLMARGGGHTTCGVAGELIEAELRIYASVIEAIIGSDNGLSPDWRQAIIQTSAGTLSIEPLGTNSSEISIKIQTLLFTKMYL